MAKLPLLLVTLLLSLILGQAANSPLAPGAKFDLAGHEVTILKFDSLPFVENDYTKRFHFDTFENPKLKQLRETYKLDEVIAPGKDEFDRQVLLMDWTHHKFKKFGTPSANPKGALEILQCVEQGHTFFCAHFAKVFVSSAASFGWVDRELALRRHQGVAKGGSSEHSSTEIWSNQYGKWVMLDPTSNMYLEKDGVPLNAYEIRQEWFYHDGKDLVFVIGKERKKYRKADLPIFLGRYAGFGVLEVSPDELDKYGFTAYIPNTNLMDAGEDYAKMFIVKDKLCDGTKWHVRTVPENPAVDPYFPIGQAALDIAPQQGALIVRIQTFTPNLKEFQISIDGAPWKHSEGNFNWRPHTGSNRLQARTLNQFGVLGPISSVELVSK
ncbi:MAG TPA: hypothetical protein VMZ27_01365 [Candidatus Saccharimonadales bacterium]|nr:hypothetical protein [Candidatus Saccharimonadales bacterium]